MTHPDGNSSAGAPAEARKDPLRTALVWTSVGLAVALAVLLALPRREKPVEVREDRPTPVKTAVLSAAQQSEVVVLPGRLAPFRSAVLAAEKPGRIVKIEVERGSIVTNGQVVVRMDGRTWENVRRQAAMEKDEADRDLARWTELRRTGAVPDRDFETMRKRCDLAAVALDQALVTLSHCRAASPMDGLVEAKFAEEGEYATEGKPLVSVVDVSRLKLTVTVPERETVALKPEQPLPFGVMSYPGMTFTGRVTFISSVADSASSAFDVEAVVPNPDGLLKGGMIANVSIARPLPAGCVIAPISAIVPRKGDTVAFVVEDDRAILRVVRIAALLREHAAISEGLKAGDEVVLDGNRGLEDGAAVERMNDEPPASPNGQTPLTR